MWRIPEPLRGGSGGGLTLYIDSDVYIGNLWLYMGSPSGPQNVEVVVDGATAASIFIWTDWDGGSTFTIRAINGGRIVGLAGAGGDGGAAFGINGEAGEPGGGGGSAIASAFDIDLDIDDGYLFGGGGGGGGGSFNGIVDQPGGGGGGGRGWPWRLTGTYPTLVPEYYPTVLKSAGGIAGTAPYYTSATDGGEGDLNSYGGGGLGGYPNVNNGGAGGDWGSAGTEGMSHDLLGVSPTSWFYHGGVGGIGGAAFRSFDATANKQATLIGSLTETQLRTAGRIKGSFNNGVQLGYANSQYLTVRDLSGLGLKQGFIFKSTGELRQIYGGVESTMNITPSTYIPFTINRWLEGQGVGNGADYEIRVTATEVDDWDITPGPNSVWYPLSVDREFSHTQAGARQCATHIQIRHTSQTGLNEYLRGIFIGASNFPY